MIIHLGDEFIPFVKCKMQEIDKEAFNDEDIALLSQNKHEILASMYKDNIVNFICLVFVNDIPIVTYSWSDNTIVAKKLFVKHIREFVELYPNAILIDETKEHPLHKLCEKEKKRYEKCINSI